MQPASHVLGLLLIFLRRAPENHPVSVDELAVLQGSPTESWPELLSLSAEAVEWISLCPKGPDYAEYQRRGDTPDWFPSQLYSEWVPSFSDYTPRKLAPAP